MLTNENAQRELGTCHTSNHLNVIITRNASVRHDYSVIEQFRSAMQDAGIHHTGEIIADGKLHRFHIEGQKKCTKNGAYVLHLDGHPAGWFMDYKTGLSQRWKSSANASKAPFTLARQIRQANYQREAEIHQKHKKAASKANHIWSRAAPAIRQEDHPYLAKKRIQPHSARLYRGALVIPLYNESDKLVNLQFISPKGVKRFLSGGRKRGCFHIMGALTERILICEGYATGISLFEDSGQRVVIAFDAGNLLPVAKNVREFSPDTEIILCGDNDLSGVGQAKAREAALAIGAKVLIPPVSGQDWNDVLKGVCQHG
jgi:putative DNA primase/helicase